MPYKKLARQLLTLIDLTSLSDTDTDASIKALCQNAITEYGHVAAVCIYPQFVKLAREQLGDTFVKIATVCNFPTGTANADDTCKAIRQAIADGAQEIDVVIPYQDLLSNRDTDGSRVKSFVASCKKACGEQVLLKTILETGALETDELIARASRAAIGGGANFLKTSTGKIEQGATLHAVEIMLETIAASNANVGIKASGAIRSMFQAEHYINLVHSHMGQDWINSRHLRFGASLLLVDILMCLNPPSD